jgi:hypothetical protein
LNIEKKTDKDKIKKTQKMGRKLASQKNVGNCHKKNPSCNLESVKRGMQYKF